MILVTGGTGYIGSHLCVRLIEKGHDVTILDNLSNSTSETLNKIKSIVGVLPHFIEGDVRDGSLLNKVFNHNKFKAVAHLAGLKSVSESTFCPIKYYDNNVCGSIELFNAMDYAGVFTLLFSSTAAVYDETADMPLNENSPLRPKTPYGQSKLIVENIIRDLYKAQPKFKIVILRYFNPAGAHQSGLIGESPLGTPDNLMPYISQVAIGHRPILKIFGNNYPTQDGTGLRDYIHVMDLAEGHISALHYIKRNGGLVIANLGTGKCYSVLEVIKAFSNVSGRDIPHKIANRRTGDVAICYADPQLAENLFSWKSKLSLEDTCKDAWKWQSVN